MLARPIHPHAWKRHSPKSICKILGSVRLSV
jgi:hypothetical protein